MHLVAAYHIIVLIIFFTSIHEGLDVFIEHLHAFPVLMQIIVIVSLSMIRGILSSTPFISLLVWRVLILLFVVILVVVCQLVKHGNLAIKLSQL